MKRKEDILARKRKYGEAYRLTHKEYFVEKNADYTINNREAISERKRKYYLENAEKLRENRKTYYLNNKERVNKQSVKRCNERKLCDSTYKLKANIRGLINSTIKLSGCRKNSKTEKILGCTFEEFKMYLESNFEPWMNWTNHGNWNGEPNEIGMAWDIDHIIPISKAINEDDVIKLNHYTNFQPLCSYTNRHIKRNNVFIMDIK
jgi:hypothetical protein